MPGSRPLSLGTLIPAALALSSSSHQPASGCVLSPSTPRSAHDAVLSRTLHHTSHSAQDDVLHARDVSSTLR